ncbi:hypothetical protein N0V90_012800 [Kalmusia sp. IMI 367209]|nr:hypothetical protein N0V90_012800 [Kalmusia sp. IMI 367209]
MALLAQLPVEVLRTILLRLPSGAALAFILTCRYIHDACDDWTTWRDLIAAQRTLADAYHTFLRYRTKRDGWKRYVVADALANQLRPLDSKDVERWLPHVIALQHPVLASIDVPFLLQLCEAICSAPIVSGHDVDPESQAVSTFPLNPSRTEDTHTWRIAQAAGFCLSVRLLADPPPLAGTEPPCLPLRSVQWFRLTDYRGLDVGSRDPIHHLVMLHALANRVVGLFYQALRWGLANDGMCTTSRAGLILPPTIFSLPLPMLCAPPMPFTPDGLTRFSTCHLATMTDPSFFVDDEWTGYTSSGGGPKTLFSGVGGDNVDVSFNRLDELPNDEYPFRVERVIRFRLVREWDGGDKYLLQSNCFQTQGNLNILRVTVHRATGHLKIAHNYPPQSSWAVLDAVMTPFGIVEAVHPQGYWSWFWKYPTPTLVDATP